MNEYTGHFFVFDAIYIGSNASRTHAIVVERTIGLNRAIRRANGNKTWLFICFLIFFRFVK